MDYFDELLYHEVMTIFYGNEFSSEQTEEFEVIKNQIKELLSQEQSITTKRQARELLLHIKDILDYYEDDLEDNVKEMEEILVQNEAEWFSSLLSINSGKEISIPGTLIASIFLIPFTIDESVKSFIKKFVTGVKNACSNIINAGLFMSSTIEQILENFDKVMSLQQKKLSLESQTMVKSFVDNTQNQIKKANPKIFTGYKWCSILDSQTCDACADLDGSVYNTISDAPFSPIHYRCRCQTIGFLQEEAEPNWTSFGEWVEKLPEDKQVDVLGKKRFELWKNGDLKIKDFVNDGHKIKLKDLYKTDTTL